jgi:hypothetical protein
MKNVMVGFLGVLCLVVSVQAQSDNETLRIDAQVDSRFKIEINTSSVTFTRAVDPSTNPVIVQNEPPIQIRVKATRARNQGVYLKIRAVADLSDGHGHTISVGNVTWQATGTGYTSNGTLVRNFSLQLGYWAESGDYSGTLTFRFQDNPNYYPGVYSVTVTLTVSPN